MQHEKLHKRIQYFYQKKRKIKIYGKCCFIAIFLIEQLLLSLSVFFIFEMVSVYSLILIRQFFKDLRKNLCY